MNFGRLTAEGRSDRLGDRGRYLIARKSTHPSLVDSPVEVIVPAISSASGATLIVGVAASDAGKVIGKTGAELHGLFCTILSASSMKIKHVFLLWKFTNWESKSTECDIEEKRQIRLTTVCRR